MEQDKEHDRLKEVLITKKGNIYSVWDINSKDKRVGKAKIKQFNSPSPDVKRLGFNILSPTEIYESSGKVFDFNDGIVLFETDKAYAEFAVSNRKIILNIGGSMVCWNMETNTDDEFEDEIHFNFLIPGTSNVCATRIYDVDDKPYTEIYIFNIENKSKIKISDTEGVALLNDDEIATFDDLKFTIFDSHTYEKKGEYTIPEKIGNKNIDNNIHKYIIYIIKITLNRFIVVLRASQHHYQLCVFSPDNNDLSSLGSSRQSFILYNLPYRNQFAYHFREGFIFKLVNYSDLDPYNHRTIYLFSNDDRPDGLEFAVFNIDKEREYSDTFAKILEKYMIKPLTKIIRKFLII